MTAEQTERLKEARLRLSNLSVIKMQEPNTALKILLLSYTEDVTALLQLIDTLIEEKREADGLLLEWLNDGFYPKVKFLSEVKKYLSSQNLLQK